MKRFFINQNDLSDKFWNIEYEGEEQIVHYGKIGTAGREMTKKFASEEECQKESEKLIAQKMKKGYVEVSPNEEIPAKIEMSEEEKAEFLFWEAIEKSYKYNKKKWEDYDIEEHLEKLTNYLSKYGKERLVAFEKTLQEKLMELYTAQIAELYIILNCDFEKKDDIYSFEEEPYISADGFIYFRCWLLLKGKEFFEDITKDINAFISGKYHFDIGDTWAEGLLYVSDDAYSENHENEDECEIRDIVYEKYPHINYDNIVEMKEKFAVGKELFKKYPALVEQICDLR